MAESTARVDSVGKSFGAKPVLSGLSLAVARGSVFGLVGLNGAGKTTLIRLLLGLLKPDVGEIRVLGFDPWRHQPEYYQRLGVLLEHDGFNGNLNFRSNIEIFAAAKSISRSSVSEYLKTYWSTCSLVDSKKKTKLFSRGQRMQCAICRAFLGWPELCILDEPAVSLDIEAYEHFCGLVHEARRRGCSVFISSHQLGTIEELCDEVGLLEQGKVRLIGTGDSGDGKTPWLLFADNEARFGETISALSGTEARFSDGAWRFVVHQAPSMVPQIVAALVKEGCAVREVRPEQGQLAQAIKGSRGGLGS